MTMSTAGEMTKTEMAAFRKTFAADPHNTVLQNAITETTVTKMVVNRAVVERTDNTFSNKLDDWQVTNQKASGRCWIFAALNLLRVGAAKKMKLAHFEFSQNHVLFWDKFEKANYFLEAMIETADRDIDDRTVAFLIRGAMSDGGQWNMFVNIVRKYGLVPKSAMPETESSSSTGVMNQVLVARLRHGAHVLRDEYASGARLPALRKTKQGIMQDIYRILCLHLGNPPDKVQWQWNDKKKKFHRSPEMTPVQFARRYTVLPIEKYACLVHDPRRTSPVGRTFTVEYLGNVVGGEQVKYLNISVDLMKKIAMQLIRKGIPVWFGCDVGKMMEKDKGIWDAEMMTYETLYNMPLSLGKADRLLYQDTAMTHAMLFTGVDVFKGKPRRWRVENSWGDQRGADKGFWLMNDSWFDEHMFEIAAPISSLPPALRRAWKRPPIVLPAWDPMGSLAHMEAVR